MEGGEHYGSQENSKEGRKEDREEGGKEGSKEDREEASVVFVRSIPKEKQNPIVSTRGFCRLQRNNEFYITLCAKRYAQNDIFERDLFEM